MDDSSEIPSSIRKEVGDGCQSENVAGALRAATRAGLQEQAAWATPMKLLLAFRLFGFVIGIALQLSLFLLIKRFRRIQKLEVLFLSLITCLFIWNLSNFLYHLFKITQVRSFLALLSAESLAFSVLAFLPSLLLHTHLVFQQRYLVKPLFQLNQSWELALYAPLALLPWALADFLKSHDPARSILTATMFARPFAGWFGFSLLASVFIEWRMLQQTQKPEERNLYRVLIIIFLAVAGLIFYVYYLSDFHVRVEAGSHFEALLMLWSIIPSALLGYYIFRHNFLEIAIQRSFGYSFAGMLLLLVYLLSVQWLREFVETAYSFPGLVVEAGLILALLAFSQPLRRWIDSSVNTLFSIEISKFQKMAVRLDEVSRSTVDMDQLLRFVEELLSKELDLKKVEVVLYPEPGRDGQLEPGALALAEKGETILLTEGPQTLGEIRIQGQSDKLSTEQQAGLRFLVTQIVAAIKNCKLAEGKVRLERELAERDKMATLGQLAATVAHNIKNPLSSIKTIVQLMQEDGEVHSRYARDLSLIKSEIDRLSHNVSRLLNFSKPTVLLTTRVDLNQVLENTLRIFKPEAEQRGIRFELGSACQPLTVRGSEEVLSEILQNLIVNAIEVSAAQSRITIRTQMLENASGKKAVVCVEDEGPGIAPEIRQQIFKPFFTTKQKGTGLGLAVVHRRALDLGGEIDCTSPLSQNGGTRFELSFPLIE
ncbi:MAG: hypothetical protein DMG06_07780 [Acidobacteria bacterium]|nr:MAG: hypothetical protein DMG06_07780 [Acidobacteriota bacterium]